jgi:hypothetical protein
MEKKEEGKEGFAKFVMAVLLLGTIIATVMYIIFIGPKKAHGENKHPVDNFTYQLFIGERDASVIHDNVGRASAVFDFPWVKTRRTFSDIKTFRRNGEEFAEPAPRSEERINYPMSYFVFFIVTGFISAGIIWLVSFGMKLYGMRGGLLKGLVRQ